MAKIHARAAHARDGFDRHAATGAVKALGAPPSITNHGGAALEPLRGPPQRRPPRVRPLIDRVRISVVSWPPCSFACPLTPGAASR